MHTAAVLAPAALAWHTMPVCRHTWRGERKTWLPRVRCDASSAPPDSSQMWATSFLRAGRQAGRQAGSVRRQARRHTSVQLVAAGGSVLTWRQPQPGAWLHAPPPCHNCPPP
jgi:hypothetical protein